MGDLTLTKPLTKPAGHGLHAKALEHAHVAVAAADQHNVSEDRLVRLLHGLFSFFCAVVFFLGGGSGQQIVHEFNQRGLLGLWGK